MSADSFDDLPSLLDLEGLFPLETEQVIAERWATWTNEDVDPALEADRWVDVRPGSPVDLWSRIVRRDFAVAYDRVGVEFLAAALPAFSFGAYLDRHGQTVDVVRLPATFAEGEVTFTGTEATVIPAGTVVAVPPAAPDAEAAEFETLDDATIPAPVLPATDGVVDVPIRARQAGVIGNVGPDAIVNILTGPDVEVANSDATVGGTERQGDPALLRRILNAYRSPRGGGRVADFVAFAEAEPGVVDVAVHRRHAGAGTVLIVVTGAGGQPVSASTLASLEARRASELPLEPDVTIATSVILNVTIAADVELEDGYTLAGTASTPAVQPAAEDTVGGYVASVRSGGEVTLADVIGQLARTPGVFDVHTGSVTINTVAGNLAVGLSPPRAPVLIALNLTVV